MGALRDALGSAVQTSALAGALAGAIAGIAAPWAGKTTSLAAHVTANYGALNPHNSGAMAVPPAITTGAGSSGAPPAPYTALTQAFTHFGGTLTPSVARFEGGGNITFSTDYRRFPVATVGASGGNVSTTEDAITWRTTVVHTGSAIAFSVLGGSATIPYRFIVNGRYVTTAGTIVSTGGRQYIVLDFGSSATRTIAVESQFAQSVRGVHVAVGDTVVAPATTYRLLALGDSFTTGTASTNVSDGFVPVVQDMLGLSDAWCSGVGGTGYVNNAGTKYALPTRIGADMDRFLTYGAADIVLLGMGINDIGLGGVQAAADSCIATARQKAPGAVIFVLGPWDVNAPLAPVANYATTKADILAAVNARGGALGGVYFIDVQGLSYSKGDATHPDTAGHKKIGTYIAMQIALALTATTIDAYYDPADFSTMFQDHACTTPVTAFEQTVAFMLDKSQNLQRGADVVSNGDFSNGLTGWSAIGTGGSSAVVSGELEITGSGGANPGRREVLTTTVGMCYEITATARRGTTAQNVTVGFASGTLTFTTGSNVVQTMKVYATATSTNLDLTIANAAATGTAYFDNISVKPLPGYHIGQTTAGARPTVSARYNQLVNTTGNLVSGTGWTATNVSGTVQGDGSSLVARTSTAASAYAAQTGPNVPIGMPFSARIKVKKATTGNLYGLRVQGTYPDRADAVVNLDTGAVAYSGGTSFTGISATSVLDADGFYLVTLTATVAVSPVLQFIHGPATNATNSWEATSASLIDAYAKRPQITLGATALRYQYVNTATDYDTVGFPAYLRGDGTDDGIFTPYLPAGKTFPFSMSCGLKANANALGGAFGLWGGAPPYYEIQKTSTLNQWRAFDRGATNYNNTETSTAAASVLTMEMTSTSVNLRVDATDPTAATTQDNAIGTLTDLRIFNGGGGFFNGQFFGGMLKFGTWTTQQRAFVEQAMLAQSTVY